MSIRSDMWKHDVLVKKLGKRGFPVDAFGFIRVPEGMDKAESERLMQQATDEADQALMRLHYSLMNLHGWVLVGGDIYPQPSVDAFTISHNLTMSQEIVLAQIDKEDNGKEQVIKRVAERFKTREEIEVWYNTGKLPGFGEATAAQLVARGNVDWVMQMMDGLDAGVHF